MTITQKLLTSHSDKEAQCSSSSSNSSNRYFFDVVEDIAKKDPDRLAALEEVVTPEDGKTENAGETAGKHQTGKRPIPERVSYGELVKFATKLSLALATRLNSLKDADKEGSLVIATKMKRGTAFYAVFCAAARLHLPSACLSTDLSNKEAEAARNSDIIKEHCPVLVITDEFVSDEDLQGATCVVTLKELWKEVESIVSDPDASEEVRKFFQSRPPKPAASTVLCFNYTSATTGAPRCAKITHGMSLHEIRSYPSVFQLGQAGRVLQQHSLFWGASAFGEVDIALAFGCALVFTEAHGVEGVTRAIKATGATCAGLVPSVLAALEASDVPSLKVVLTWGEALLPRVAREWAARLHLIDLLISTEAWLALWADWSSFNGGRDRPLFKSLPSVTLKLKPLENEDEVPPLEDSAIACGELLISGDMVTPGYTDESRNKAAFLDEDGTRWYRTKDLLAEHQGGGFSYVGRADDFFKIGAEWVHAQKIEERVCNVPGVKQARLHREGLKGAIFAVMEPGSAASVVQMQQQLPIGISLFVVPNLPKRSGNDKVDFVKLRAMVSPNLDKDKVLEHMTNSEEEFNHFKGWWSPILALWVATLLHVTISMIVASLGGGGLMSFIGRWMLTATAGSSWGCILGRIFLILLRVLFEGVLRTVCITYMVLAEFHYSKLRGRKVMNYIPFSWVGLFTIILSVLPFWMAPLAASPGIRLAVQRQRLRSWPIVCLMGFPFWSRNCGTWWVKQGFKGALSWWWKDVSGHIAKNIRSCLDSAKLKIGLTKRCHWCKHVHPHSEGSVNLEVDQHWYCQNCWAEFGQHRQCAQCSRWTKRGSDDPTTGEYLCGGCLEKRTKPQQEGNTPQTEVPSTQSSPVKVYSEGSPEPEVGEPASPSPAAASPTAAHDHSTAEDAKAAEAAEAFDTSRRQQELEAHDQAVTNLYGDEDKEEERPDEHSEELVPPPTTSAKAGGSESTQAAHLTQGMDWLESYRRVAEARGIVRADPREFRGVHLHEISLLGSEASQEEEPTEDGGDAPRKTPEWITFERATGLVIRHPEKTGLSLDSLKITKFVSALRRQHRVQLKFAEVKACTSLAALLELIERSPRDEEEVVKEKTTKAVVEVSTWFMMWNSQCRWTLHRPGALTSDIIKAVMNDLVMRHPSLRVRLGDDPPDLFSMTQKAWSVCCLWQDSQTRLRLCGEKRTLSAALQQKALAAVRWGFRASWPRVCIEPDCDLDNILTIMEASTSKDEAKAHAWVKNFVPPVKVVVAPYCTEEGETGSFWSIVITHMLSDGYCILPVSSDLGQLIDHHKALAEQAAEVPSAPPGLPCAMHRYQERLHATLSGNGPIGERITTEALDRQQFGTHGASTHYAHIPPNIVGRVREVAQTLGLADDIVLLTIVGASLARFLKQPNFVACMICPLRDGPGEGDMVALFAEMRFFPVRTDGLSFLGTALQLNHLVKERAWHPPPCVKQTDTVFVNFEWTDHDGPHGFEQLENPTIRAESIQNPLKVAVDQPDPHSWRMRCGFDDGKYPREEQATFFELFEASLFAMLEDPLIPVWPVES